MTTKVGATEESQRLGEELPEKERPIFRAILGRSLSQNPHPKIPSRAIRPPAPRSATAQLPAAGASSQRCPAPRVEWPLPECGQPPLLQYLSDSTNKDFFSPPRTPASVRARSSPPPSIPPRPQC